jgi:hypothetical protein
MSKHPDQTFQHQIAKDLQDRDKLVKREARPPTPPKVHKVHTHSFLWRFSTTLSWLCLIGAVIGTVVAVLSWRHNPASAPSPFVNVIVGCVSVLAFYWLFALCFLFLRAVHQNAKAAFTPVPSLQSIDAQLRQEFPGYEPTLQDLLAVETRLKSERNEAALVTGGLLIGAHLAAHQAQGKPLL